MGAILNRILELDLTYNSSYQSRIGLIIDKIHTTSSLVQAEQYISHNAIDQQLHEQSRLLAAILSGQSDLQGLIQPQSTLTTCRTPIRDQQTSADRQIPRTVIRIRAHTFFQKVSCKPYCTCTCHNTKTLRSPKIFRKITGDLFIGYSGHPLWARSNCTAVDCLASSMSQVSVCYLFPSWLLNTAVSVAVLANSYERLSASLTIRRIIPHSAEVIRLEQVEDINGMRRLFDLGHASPNDSVPLGDSILSVR